MHRKNQNLQVWKLAADRSRNFKPTLARHADVEYRDVAISFANL
jgi:hypothetical protein